MIREANLGLSILSRHSSTKTSMIVAFVVWENVVTFE